MRAIGLMSGTSLDGIDAALIETDGEDLVNAGPWLTVPYEGEFQARLREAVMAQGAGPDLEGVAGELVSLHADAVRLLLARAALSPVEVGVVGFHGHTVDHDPARRRTVQIGDGGALAAQVGIPVVGQFRTADVAAGGQGAPLVPLYHGALAATLPKPLAVLNLGGVANVTYLGDAGPIAFDTGPGMALIDDLFLRHTGRALDPGGAVSAGGRVDRACLARLLDNPYFAAPVPKSLDRNAFDGGPVAGLSLADAGATLAAFTAEAVGRARPFFPAPPRRWLVTGGGRHSRAVMDALARVLQTPVAPVEAVGWQGDALEAQAFGYLAVRSLRGLPLTLPSTTGVRAPLTGGTLYRPGADRGATTTPKGPDR